MFDIAGNSLRYDEMTDTLSLSDQLVPTVDSISIPNGSPISPTVESPINVSFSEPIQSFNFTVSARHYNNLSYFADTTANGFLLTLRPPMASLDTITMTILNLTDSAGLEAVDFSYEFYTPALGDYDISGKIDVITSLFDIVDSLIVGGGMGYTFAKAMGGKVGNSLVEKEKLSLAKNLIETAKTKGVSLLLPLVQPEVYSLSY